jgi:hypothetical protein
MPELITLRKHATTIDNFLCNGQSFGDVNLLSFRHSFSDEGVPCISQHSRLNGLSCAYVIPVEHSVFAGLEIDFSSGIMDSLWCTFQLYKLEFGNPDLLPTWRHPEYLL